MEEAKFLVNEDRLVENPYEQAVSETGLQWKLSGNVLCVIVSKIVLHMYVMKGTDTRMPWHAQGKQQQKHLG